MTELSPEALARIQAQAKAEISKELQAHRELEERALAKAALAEEKHRLRYEAGLTTAADDLVEFTVNAPPFAKEVVINLGLDNERHFEHGYTYTERRAVYDVVREQIARGWDAERRAGNPNLRFYDQRFTGTMNPYLGEKIVNGAFAARSSSINGATGDVVNAPTDPAGGRV